MSLQVLENISTISYICSAVLFAVAIGLYFYFDINTVYGYLSGRTRKKRIEESRKDTTGENRQSKRDKKTQEERRNRWAKQSKTKQRETVALPEIQSRRQTVALEDRVVRRRGGTAILTDSMEQSIVSMPRFESESGFEGFEIEFEIQGLATDKLVI